MATSTSSLRRELGLGSAAAAVAGEAIAVGIFLTPAGMAKSLGSPFWLLVVWLTLGALTLSGALCFGELAARFPQAGGLYIYLREAYGSRVAFLYGWMSLFVMDPGITAAIAMGMAAYASYIVAWPPIVTKLVGVGAIVLLCFLNILNTRIGAGLLRALTWLKFLILGVLVVWALVFHLGSWSHFKPFVAQHPGSTPLLPALAGALVAAFFSFGGWWDVSKIAGEVKDPTRTLPRALVLGVLAVIAAYIAVSAIFIYLVPIESVTSDQTFVAQAGAVLFGRIGADLLSGAVVICVLGTLAALIMVCPRVYYAMAKDGIFLSSVSRTHPVHGTPSRAIMIQGTMSSILVLLGTFDQILGYLIFSAVLFLGLTVAGLFLLRRRSHDQLPSVPTPGYPVTPLLFLLLVAAMLFLMAMRSPRQASLGILVVLAGLPVHEIIHRRRRTIAITEPTLLNENVS